MRIACTQELHGCGGPGTFFLCPAETAADALAETYGGTVQLIYLDPPFGTGDTFHMRLSSGSKTVRLPVFSDKLDEDAYVAWMRPILMGCRKLLSPTGSLYLHIDYRMNARMRLLMDEIFGRNNFMNEIVWCYRSGGRSTRYYPRKHDSILFYRKGRNVFFNIDAVGKPRGPEKRNHMKRFTDDAGRVCFSIKSAGKTYVYYEDTPVYPSDVWTDIEHLQQKDAERVGYATQKPEALLSRIIQASSRPGDLVADLFSGSGTTAAAASKLGRRFLVADASPFALYTLRARQLKNASAPSLLDGAHQLLLRYPAEEAPAEFHYEIKAEDGRQYALIDRARFDAAHPPVYAALGTVKDGRFLPGLTDCAPRLPIRLDLTGLLEPVFQFTDTLGRQAFYRL